MTTGTLSIDASALDGYDLTAYFAAYFEAFDSGTADFYGGFPDVGFGGAPFFVSGSQVLTTYNLPPEGEGEDAEPVPTDTVALIEGEGLAYDFIHHGAQFGHGITGKIDSLTTGTFVDGQTTAEIGTGPQGAVTGLQTGLVITGFDLEAEPGAGPVPTNPVYALYAAVRDLDAAAVNALLESYALAIQGSEAADVLRGFQGDDTLMGGAGDDVARGARASDVMQGDDGNDELRGGKGRDMVEGGAGDDDVRGGAGRDQVKGDDGNDTLIGGAGRDVLIGGEGEDTFLIRTTSARDLITDFVPGEDVIDVSALGLSGLDDFTVSETEKGVWLEAGSVRIRLDGLTEDDLDGGDFLF